MTLAGLVRATALCLCWMLACATQLPAVVPAIVAMGASEGAVGSLTYPPLSSSRVLLTLGADDTPYEDREGRYRVPVKPSEDDDIEYAFDDDGGGSIAGVGLGTPPTGRAAQIPPIVLAAYRNAQERSGEVAPGCYVPWYVLAGIGRVESGHARHGSNTVISPDGRVSPPIIGAPLNGTGGTAAIRDTDSGRWDGDTVWDRAVGPMQFIPSSWRLFGQDGNDDGLRDPNNVFDAALAAAAHLCRSAPGDYDDPEQLARALFAYNRSREYVSIVMGWIATYAGSDPGGGGTITPLPSPRTVNPPDAQVVYQPRQRYGDASAAVPRPPASKPNPPSTPPKSASPRPSPSPTPTQTAPAPSPTSTRTPTERPTSTPTPSDLSPTPTPSPTDPTPTPTPTDPTPTDPTPTDPEPTPTPTDPDATPGPTDPTPTDPEPTPSKPQLTPSDPTLSPLPSPSPSPSPLPSPSDPALDSRSGQSSDTPSPSASEGESVPPHRAPSPSPSAEEPPPAASTDPPPPSDHKDPSGTSEPTVDPQGDRASASADSDPSPAPQKKAATPTESGSSGPTPTRSGSEEPAPSPSEATPASEPPASDGGQSPPPAASTPSESPSASPPSEPSPEPPATPEPVDGVAVVVDGNPTGFPDACAQSAAVELLRSLVNAANPSDPGALEPLLDSVEDRETARAGLLAAGPVGLRKIALTYRPDTPVEVTLSTGAADPWAIGTIDCASGALASFRLVSG